MLSYYDLLLPQLQSDRFYLPLNDLFLLTIAGGYSVEHIDKVCMSLLRQYGKCVKMEGLVGRPDMLFVFDASEVERVFRGEDAAPQR